jgi:hypothetical protein
MIPNMLLSFQIYKKHKCHIKGYFSIGVVIGIHFILITENPPLNFPNQPSPEYESLQTKETTNWPAHAPLSLIFLKPSHNRFLSVITNSHPPNKHKTRGGFSCQPPAERQEFYVSSKKRKDFKSRLSNVNKQTIV